MRQIKYHEWGKAPNEYGEDHALTDNWVADADYGNECVSVYFNIETVGYNCINGGFSDNNARNAWISEAEKIIAEFNFINGTEYDTQRTENKFYLYPHPQQFSGVIPKNDVKYVAERIEQSEVFKIRWVDLRETVYIISDDEYEAYLRGKEEHIQDELFKKCVTTRTNMFYSVDDIARSIANKFRLRRLGFNDGRNGSDGQTSDYIKKVIDTMVECGLLISKERYGNKYIRSLNKTEQRKKFKKLLYA